MTYDEASVKMNTQSAPCCASCAYWKHEGNLEGTCSVLEQYTEDDDSPNKSLPLTMAYIMCDCYDEGDHEGTEVIR